jgi:hypothetical protein
MFTLRPTKKLREHLGLRLSPAEAPGEEATTRLGDWYANLLMHHRGLVVIFVSERTLLPVVVPAAPALSVLPRFRDALAEMLGAIGVSREDVKAELREMEPFSIGKTTSRRILGSMTDFAWLLEASSARESLLDAALVLAKAPCSPIDWKSPRASTEALFGAGGHLRLVE